MVVLTSLWLPIVLSVVIVFLASWVAWTLSPHHRSDFRGIPKEEEVAEVLRRQKLSPGMYMIPYCKGPEAMKDPAVAARFTKGPVGILTLQPAGLPRMGKSLPLSFLANLLVSFFVAYVVGRALAPGTEPSQVFRMAGTVAFMAYSFALLWDAIWMGKPWGHVGKSALDGLVYGLLTGGVFAWLWPS